MSTGAMGKDVKKDKKAEPGLAMKATAVAASFKWDLNGGHQGVRQVWEVIEKQNMVAVVTE